MRMHERMPRLAGRPRGPGWLYAALTFALGLSPTAALAQGAGGDTLALTWTAPGDDGPVGTASVYELRMSPAPIDDANWGAAILVSGLPVPLPAGTRQRTVVRGLTAGTTYYFAIRTADEAGNWSGLSNLLRWDWVYDTAPPAAPSGLTASLQGESAAQLSWSPNSEADLAGYTIYRSLNAGGTFTAVDGTPAGTTSYVDTSIPSGSSTVWYQVTARDAAGNESARSGVASVTLASGTTAWAMRTVTPNPARPGSIVRIPVVVPPGGGSARIEIVNSIGQRVRRIDLGMPAPGTSDVQWDGRNDSGREVAPGSYTAWLIAGSTRIGVRLVRVP